MDFDKHHSTDSIGLYLPSKTEGEIMSKFQGRKIDAKTSDENFQYVIDHTDSFDFKLNMTRGDYLGT